MGALTGLKVLDLSRVLAGPWASQILADLGAEVIKIERPGTGDDTRGWGPPFMPADNGRPTADAAYFHGANRNKFSVCIDIAHRNWSANGGIVVDDKNMRRRARSPNRLPWQS